jgi:hypothetical protein
LGTCASSLQGSALVASEDYKKNFASMELQRKLGGVHDKERMRHGRQDVVLAKPRMPFPLAEVGQQLPGKGSTGTNGLLKGRGGLSRISPYDSVTSTEWRSPDGRHLGEDAAVSPQCASLHDSCACECHLCCWPPALRTICIPS